MDFLENHTGITNNQFSIYVLKYSDFIKFIDNPNVGNWVCNRNKSQLHINTILNDISNDYDKYNTFMMNGEFIYCKNGEKLEQIDGQHRKEVLLLFNNKYPNAEFIKEPYFTIKIINTNKSSEINRVFEKLMNINPYNPDVDKPNDNFVNFIEKLYQTPEFIDTDKKSYFRENTRRPYISIYTFKNQLDKYKIIINENNISLLINKMIEINNDLLTREFTYFSEKMEDKYLYEKGKSKKFLLGFNYKWMDELNKFNNEYIPVKEEKYIYISNELMEIINFSKNKYKDTKANKLEISKIIMNEIDLDKNKFIEHFNITIKNKDKIHDYIFNNFIKNNIN